MYRGVTRSESFAHLNTLMNNPCRSIDYLPHSEEELYRFTEGSFVCFAGCECKCRHHQHGRWQARIGRVSGNKDLYLGTFSMQPPSVHLCICSCICILIHSATQKLLLRSASICRRRRLQRVRACRAASSRSAGSMATDGDEQQGGAEAVMAGGYKAEPCLPPSSFSSAHACSALVCDCV